MKIVHPLAITALVMALAGCAAPPSGVRTTGTDHGRGADVFVWVADGNLTVSEEPIHRSKSDGRDIVFVLDNDSETAKYKFPDGAVTFKKATKEFDCNTRNEKVTCTRTGVVADKFPYSIMVVPKSNAVPVPPLDPFIITH